MIWQYRTIVFEFAKDGLLGERYIDDEAMELTLNEQGIAGWELVSVVMVQEGVLAVLKRQGSGEGPALERPVPNAQSRDNAQTDHFSVEEGVVEKVEPQPVAAKGESVTAEEIQRQEREHIRQLEEQRQKKMEDHENDRIGEIKIS